MLTAHSPDGEEGGKRENRVPTHESASRNMASTNWKSFQFNLSIFHARHFADSIEIAMDSESATAILSVLIKTCLK